MKRFLLLYWSFVLVFFITEALGQKIAGEDPYKAKSSVKKAKEAVSIADKYFDNFEYYLAAQEYYKAVAEDPGYIYAIYHLAESYRLYFNYDNAKKYYRLVLEKNKEAYPLARYWYANMLKNKGQYAEALENFETFMEEYPDGELNAKQLKEKAKIDAGGCVLAMNELKKPVRNYHFHVLKSPVNSEASEYAPAILDNDTVIVITSARSGTVGDKDFNVLGGKFSDFFRFVKGKDSTWREYTADDKFKDLNTAFNEGSGSFTADRKKFYFTRADERNISQEYIDYMPAIYVSRFEKGKWSKPERLNENINMKGEYNAEPSISPKGDTLFFVSKRPGGKGQHDIYYSVNSGGENWQAAINLEAVNTPFIEKSPCYYPKEQTLFFSSNGREGFGGLDIFKATGKGFANIDNIGLPFNSNMDDFYFVLGEEKGYLASNREGGMGNDDIYFFNVKSSEAIVAEINRDSLLAEIKRDTLYAVTAVDDAMDHNNGGKDQHVTSAVNMVDDQMIEIKSISIIGRVLIGGTNQPAADVENKLIDKDGRVIKTTRTNAAGQFRFDNLPIEDYKVEIEDNDPRLTGEVKYLVEDIQVKTSAQEVSKKLFENIYFSFDKFVLRPEAKKVLKELSEYYKQNPEIQIEMNANTDSYGSSEYNKTLAEKRGEAALEYLIQRGVDKAALVINALGETQPLATNENAAGRQLNRRVEFHIIGGPGYSAQTMTYIADPNASIEQIAKTFNMTVDELKELNAIRGESLEAYQPLRVRRIGDADIVAPITLSMIQNANPDSLMDSGRRLELRQESPENLVRRKTLKEGEDFFIVAPQNTLFSIARLFGMSLDELKELNSLSDDKIFVGQRLIVKINSAGQLKNWQYVVKDGDSMASIAKKFGLTIQELIELNNLNGYKLYENMILRVR